MITNDSHSPVEGICWSHAHILNSTCRIVIKSSDVVLSLYTLNGVAEALILMMETLNGATRVITTDDFSPELLLSMIERHKVTFAYIQVQHAIPMLKSQNIDETDISSLNVLWLGGGQIILHVKTELVSRFPNVNILPCYGMSELAGILTMDHPIVLENDTPGRLARGMCVKIADDRGNRCGVNVDGEICIKTDYEFIGYYENPKANRELFDEDGFILTGDVGHFDEKGNLFVTGRKKEILRYRNYSMNPLEIEAYLIKSPEIKSVCVVGVPDPFGDLVAAVVVRTNGSTISEKDISDLVAGMNMLAYFTMHTIDIFSFVFISRPFCGLL